MIFVRAAPRYHYDWIIDQTGLHISSAFRAIEAIEEKTGRIVGMVGYDDWTPNSVSMHMAIAYPMAVRTLVGPAFSYPFLEAQRKVILGVTPGDNERALKLNRHLGLREIYRIRDGWLDGVDMVIQEMRRDECRWIGEFHGRKSTRAA